MCKINEIKEIVKIIDQISVNNIDKIYLIQIKNKLYDLDMKLWPMIDDGK